MAEVWGEELDGDFGRADCWYLPISHVCEINTRGGGKKGRERKENNNNDR